MNETNSLPDSNNSSEIDLSQVEPVSSHKTSKLKLLGGLALLFLLSTGLSFFLRSNHRQNLARSKVEGDQTLSRELAFLESHEATTSSFRRDKVIGFLPSWMVAKEVDVKPERLSQIIYFGLGVNEKGELIQYNEEGVSVVEWTYFNSDYFANLTNEATGFDTKVLLAIKSFDNETIDNLISSQKATDKLAHQLLNIVEKFNLDGINVDFEYVTDTGFPTAKYFNRFLETLATLLREEYPNFILSVDINANALAKDPAYDMVKIGEVVDQVILMGYDYHRPSSTRAGPIAPLNAGENEHSVSKSLKALVGRVPTEKVILGVPFYGYEWQTLNSNYKSPTVANTGALATYGRVRDLIDNRADVDIKWDDKAQSPWLIYRQSGATKQIYYENERSLQAKLDLIAEKDLGGLAIWALGYEGNYPDLWQVISEKLGE